MIDRKYIHTAKRIFSIGALFLIAALIISAVEKKKGRVAGENIIEIQTLPDSSSLITRKDIEATIERSFGRNLPGMPVGSINVERVERVLESDPFVLNADVYIDSRNQVNIDIEQRLPILRVIDQNGLSYYLDGTGQKLPLSKHFAARVLVATGQIPPFDRDFLTHKKNPHRLRDLFKLTQRILKDELLEPMIEQIHVAKDGDYVMIPKVGDQKIILGNLDDLETKILYLKNFYKEALPHKGWKKYKTINLKFHGQVVASKR